MSEMNNSSPETMETFKEELESSFRKIKEGDILTGTVIGVSDTEATVDLQYYAEGIIRLEDFTDDPDFSIKKDVQVGETIKATVLSVDNGNGTILLSKKAASQILAWDKLKQMFQEQTILTVKIAGIVNSGVIAYVEGIRGFIPASKLSLEYVKDLNEWLHREIQVQIITVDQAAGKLVLSARELLKEAEAKKEQQILSNLEVGFITEGTVENIQPYGAFVRLSNGVTGLVHVSQICQKRIKTPAAVLTEGQKVRVKVIAIKDGRLSLSMKALEDSAIESIQEEAFEIPESEAISTSMGSLLKNWKLS